MIEIRKTDDGSNTLFVPELNEHYHSSHGAVQESMHVFIDVGFNFISGNNTHINILEVGFGTGLNALLTLLHSTNKTIFYHGIEAYPVSKEITGQLDYPGFLKDENAINLFEKMHQVKWNEDSTTTENFTLRKEKAKIEEVMLETDKYNLVYFDAFAPDVQPELWAGEIFRKLFNAMKPGGVLVTYSSKGLVKQNLRAAGFEVKRLCGPPGKRHIVRAAKSG